MGPFESIYGQKPEKRRAVDEMFLKIEECRYNNGLVCLTVEVEVSQDKKFQPIAKILTVNNSSRKAHGLSRAYFVFQVCYGYTYTLSHFMSCEQHRSTFKFGCAASHNSMWRIWSTLELFKPDKDLAITRNEDMKEATLAKYHARSLEIALPSRRLLLKESVEEAEQKSIIAQRWWRHLSSASIDTLLSRETTSVALADGVYCLYI